METCGEKIFSYSDSDDGAEALTAGHKGIPLLLVAVRGCFNLKYRVGQKEVHRCEYAKQSSSLEYYLLIIVLFSIGTAANLLFPHPGYEEPAQKSLPFTLFT